MGMYTELHFNVELKKGVPSDVLAILRLMLGEIKRKLDLPDHPLFKTDRWKIMFQCDSYYFKADTHSTLRYDEISETWLLCIRCNVKNYNDEIEKFVDWILPYCDTYAGDFLGFSRYEETEQPTLIHAPNKETP